MTWFAIVFSTLITVLIAVLLYAMPSITPATLPLGVSVPQARTADPVIAGSVRRFRVGVFASLVVSVIVAIVLGLIDPAAGMIAPVLVFTALGMGSYVVARGSITRAKNEGDWYDDVPVRLAADVTLPRPVAPTLFGWYLASAIVLIIAAGIGVGSYPGLPNPLPIHWDANGVANGYAEKSIWSAFGVVLVGFGMVALLFAVSFFIRVSPQRRITSDSAELAAHRSLTQQRLMGGLVGQITLVTAVLLGLLAVIGWHAPTISWMPLASVGLFLVLIAAAIAVYFVRYRRAMAAPVATAAAEVGHHSAAAGGHPATPAARADSPDDDRFWKAGMFYVNRKDPALMVPKRFGVGMTINLGHPAGIAIGVVILLIIAGSITSAILSGSHH
jgi:uncharacterized membrane protein